ncbi:MAG: hypothetical protein ABIR71_03110, partial [Chthoniobacterales bacterium]
TGSIFVGSTVPTFFFVRNVKRHPWIPVWRGSVAAERATEPVGTVFSGLGDPSFESGQPSGVILALEKPCSESIMTAARTEKAISQESVS